MNKKMIEAFTIFRRYEDGDIAAEHDIIYAGPAPNDVSEDDKLKLAELGWHVEEEFDCFFYFT